MNYAKNIEVKKLRESFKNYVLGNINLTDVQIEASDVNHSKTVTAADYGKLKNVVLMYITTATTE